MISVGSLFAGVGGFDIAAERAGMTVVWQSEIDPAASRVLEHYWPGRNLGDIHHIRLRRPELANEQGDKPYGSDWPRQRGFHNLDEGGTNGRPAAAVDVLVGGFPCQDYSVAGNRAGLAGDRGALWWQYHRLIVEGRPTWVVAENVPGLLSSRGGRDFATIIDSLTECGYGVTWAVLDAQYFGVAQRRRRVFIVAHSGGRPRPEVLALSEGVFGHPEPRRQEGQDVAGTLEARTGGGGFPGTDFALAGGVQEVTVSTYRKQRSTEYVEDDIASTIARRDYKDATDLIAFAQNQRDEVRDLNNLAGALAAEPGVKQQTYVVHATQEPIVAEDRTHTLSANSYQAVMSPQVRRLTPLECERLQGFPDGWTDLPGNSDTQRYRQMGNAVAVPVVEWIMRRIVEQEDNND